MEPLTFALLGIGVGAIYGMIAQGLVLVYRSSGILNFAQGAFLMVGAFIFYELHVLDGWPYFVALVTAMVCCAAIGASVHLFILRPMRNASALSRMIATLGVMGVISAIAVIIYQDNTEEVPASLPTSTVEVLPGIHMGIDLLIIFAIGASITFLLWTSYRFTAFGRATTAVAENQLAASVTGHSPDQVAAINWAISGALAALAGVLVAPITFLQSDTLVLLILHDRSWIGWSLLIVPAGIPRWSSTWNDAISSERLSDVSRMVTESPVPTDHRLPLRAWSRNTAPFARY